MFFIRVHYGGDVEQEKRLNSRNSPRSITMQFLAAIPNATHSLSIRGYRGTREVGLLAGMLPDTPTMG